jgi:hypothetical protein
MISRSPQDASRQLRQRRIVVAEGKTAGEQPEQDHTKRVDVGARVDRFRSGQHLFGAHVRERPQELSGLRFHGRHQHLRADRARDAEVEHLRLTVGGDEDVARLEVAMNDAALMRVLYRIADQRHQLDACARIQALAVGMIDQR